MTEILATEIGEPSEIPEIEILPRELPIPAPEPTPDTIPEEVPELVPVG